MIQNKEDVRWSLDQVYNTFGPDSVEYKSLAGLAKEHEDLEARTDNGVLNKMMADIEQLKEAVRGVKNYTVHLAEDLRTEGATRGELFRNLMKLRGDIEGGGWSDINGVKHETIGGRLARVEECLLERGWLRTRPE